MRARCHLPLNKLDQNCDNRFQIIFCNIFMYEFFYMLKSLLLANTHNVIFMLQERQL